jgi:hypothetical protein
MEEKRQDKEKKKKVLHNKVLKQKLGNAGRFAQAKRTVESVKASLRESSKTMCLGF